jgi:hypothetical protein
VLCKGAFEAISVLERMLNENPHKDNLAKAMDN